MRRVAGVLLIAGGALLLSFVGGRYTLGVLHADEARRAWNDAEARALVALARSSVSRANAEPIVSGAAVARLVIPRIGLDEIVLEGVDDDALNGGPGHYPGSAFPGEPGNAIVSAHRDRHFNHLDALEVGDTITTESGSRTSSWVVVSKRVVDRDARALFSTPDATLTLTTCWPIRYFGPAPDRLIVTAKLRR